MLNHLRPGMRRNVLRCFRRLWLTPAPTSITTRYNGASPINPNTTGRSSRTGRKIIKYGHTVKLFPHR